jgi:antitoxin (DNA-binding transcriptional repressor) of toxin-antitoxin stability system
LDHEGKRIFLTDGGRPVAKLVPAVREEQAGLHPAADDNPLEELIGALNSVDLRARGIDETQAAGLRTRLVTFAEDWDRAEMDVYDDYDSARAKLSER